MPTRPTEPADVPQTVAVALSYERGSESAPAVVARGRGHLAEAILALAFEHGVKVREDADLAAVLEAVELGEAIPEAAFAAVAEILAYLYRANAEAEATP
jgi:flagellar biosynthesis protein